MATKQRALVTYLVASVQTGDKAALSRLAGVWYPVLCGHAGRLLGRADGVEDIVQDAWIEIQRGLFRLRDAEAFPAWSLRIVSRRVAKEIKRRQRDRIDTLSPLDTSHVSDRVEPSSPPEGEAAVLAHQVRTAMAGLSPAHRATLALFYQQDFTVGEIAVALDVPSGTVKSRLSAARDALRHTLKLSSKE